MSSMDKIRTKIGELLRMCEGLPEEDIERVLDASSLRIFKSAFTHRSYDPVNNFEILEFIGDARLSYVLTRYIRNRFPDVVSEEWLTRLKHTLVSMKYFSDLTDRLGLHDLLITSVTVPQELSDATKDDLFESVFGAIAKVADDILGKGIGNHIAYNIIKTIFDDIPIRLRWDEIVDPTSRIKMVYDAIPGVEWRANHTYLTFKKECYHALVFYPDNSSPDHKIAHAHGDTLKEALEKACAYALTRKHIFGDVLESLEPSPYVYKTPRNTRRTTPKERRSQYQDYISSVGEMIDDPEEEKPDRVRDTILEPPKYFVDYVNEVLVECGVHPSIIRKLLSRRENILKILIGCISTSYDKTIEMYHAISRFESIGLFDAIIADYVSSTAPPRHSEGYLTSRKKDILLEKNFFQIVPREFVDVIQKLSEDLKDVISTTNISNKRINILFKTFISTISVVIDENSMYGIGYNVTSKLVHTYLSRHTLILVDYKSKLSEYFSLRLPKGLSESHEYVMSKTSPPGSKVETHDHIIKIFDPREEGKVIGEGVGPDKRTAFQKASQQALLTLKSPRPIIQKRPPPSIPPSKPPVQDLPPRERSSIYANMKKRITIVKSTVDW